MDTHVQEYERVDDSKRVQRTKDKGKQRSMVEDDNDGDGCG